MKPSRKQQQYANGLRVVTGITGSVNQPTIISNVKKSLEHQAILTVGKNIDSYFVTEEK
jgi:Tfp pilus assembly pilus retraction ATPase PilT